MGDLCHTVHLINSSPVTVIAGAEGKVYHLINGILADAEFGAALVSNGNALPLTVEDIEESLTCAAKPRTVCVQLKSIASANPTAVERSPSRNYASAITELIWLSERHGVKIVAALPTESRADCIAVYRKIPESVNGKVRVTLLENMGAEYRLWIEGGANLGEYVRYDCVNGVFNER